MSGIELSYKPLYRQIYHILYDRITTSVYRIGQEIPPEKALAAEFGVSISTIRQAVSLLVEEGFIIKKQGRGTFVSSNPITLTFFGWIGETEKGQRIVSRIIEIFEAKNPNLKVEYINSRYEDVKHSYIGMVQNGNAPDVVQIDNNWTSSLASMGLLEPLIDLLPAANVLSRDPEVDLHGGTYKSRLFSVAWGLGPSALIYNRKLVQQFGLKLEGELSLQTFAQICAQVSGHADNDGVAAFGLAKNIDIVYNIYPFLSAFNAKIVDEQGDIVIDSTEALEAFRWIRELFEQSRVVVGKDIRELRRYLVQDKLVFLQDGPWIGGILQEESGYHDINEYFGVMVNPRGTDSALSSFTRNHSLAISSISTKKDIAGKFVDALTSDPEITKLFVNNTGLLPASQELSAAWEQKPYFSPFLQQLKRSKPLNSNNPYFEKALKFAAAAATNILLNEYDIRTELEEKAHYLRMLYSD